MFTSQSRTRSEKDAGDTLIELMIVMIIFTLIIGVITTAIVTMMKQIDRQTGLDSNLGNARKAIETLDGQIRFANAVTTPGTGASGDQYVEFRTLQTNIANQPEVCTQWRYHVATSALQYRTWNVPTSGAAAPTDWLTTALSVSPVSGNPVFSLTPPPPAPVQTPAPDANPNDSQPHQSLFVDFVTTDGAKPVSSTSQVGLAAINSTLDPSLSVPPGPANNSFCKEVTRP
jgi:type II secretory pathway pseudopilin PulG